MLRAITNLTNKSPHRSELLLLGTALMTFSTFVIGEEVPLEPIQIETEPLKPIKPLPTDSKKANGSSSWQVSEEETEVTTPATKNAQPVKVANTGKWAVSEEEGQTKTPPPPTPRIIKDRKTPTAVTSTRISPLLQAALDEAKKNAKRYRKKPLEKVLLFQKVVDAEPGNAEARYRYALTLNQIGKSKECTDQLARAVVLEPENPKYLVDHALSASNQGQHERAIATALQAVQLAPANPRYHNALGTVLFSAGKTAASIQHFRHAVTLAPNNARYIHNLGRGFLDAGEPKEAIKVFSEVIRLRPKSARAYNDRGLAYKELKQFKLARSDFEISVKLDTTFALGFYNLAVLYSNNNNPQFSHRHKALSCAQQAAKLEPNNPDFLMALAEAYRANRRYARALFIAQQAIRIDPSEKNLKMMQEYKDLVDRGFVGRVRTVGKQDEVDGLGLRLKLKTKGDKEMDANAQ